MIKYFDRGRNKGKIQSVLGISNHIRTALKYYDGRPTGHIKTTAVFFQPGDYHLLSGTFCPDLICRRAKNQGNRDSESAGLFKNGYLSSSVEELCEVGARGQYHFLAYCLLRP